MCVGVGGVLVAHRLWRYRYPNPERVFTSVLPILRANNEVREEGGGGREGERKRESGKEEGEGER